MESAFYCSFRSVASPTSAVYIFWAVFQIGRQVYRLVDLLKNLDTPPYSIFDS